MINNIERLYKLAKIKPLCQIPDEYCGMKNIYVEFDAEKQLELIKWLILNPFIDEISLCYNEPSKTYNIEIYNIPECGNFRDSRIEFNSEFEHTLAGLVCELWEDLTDEQQMEIKRILE